MALIFDEYPDISYSSDLPSFDDPEEMRQHRKWEVAIGYRIFSKLRWGHLGDGHSSARDPILTDHFWVLGYGIPFWAATVDKLILVGPGANAYPQALLYLPQMAVQLAVEHGQVTRVIGFQGECLLGGRLLGRLLRGSFAIQCVSWPRGQCH
mgnify:CR=1 FL=1